MTPDQQRRVEDILDKYLDDVKCPDEDQLRRMVSSLVQAQDWQPIATAPREPGSRFLLWSHAGVEIARLTTALAEARARLQAREGKSS